MRIAIFTQDERVYLPLAIEHVAEAMPDRIACILLSSPLAGKDSKLRSAWRNAYVLGLRGIVVMGLRVLHRSLAPRMGLRPRGRRYWSIPQIGEALNIPTYRVDNVNGEAVQRILDEHPADLLVSVSCPQIIRKRLVERFPQGAINVHSAPLPRYRGLLPSFWQLYHDEPETAVTVHELDSRIDNGRILLQRSLPIEPGETWDRLMHKTKHAAGEVLVEAVKQIENGTAAPRPNEESEATYFSFPTLQEARAFRARGKRMF